MHKKGMVHGDLKASNVLYDKDASGTSSVRIVTKATAFSTQHLRDYHVSSTQGCAYWISPELDKERTD